MSHSMNIKLDLDIINKQYVEESKKIIISYLKDNNEPFLLIEKNSLFRGIGLTLILDDVNNIFVDFYDEKGFPLGINGKMFDNLSDDEQYITSKWAREIIEIKLQSTNIYNSMEELIVNKDDFIKTAIAKGYSSDGAWVLFDELTSGQFGQSWEEEMKANRFTWNNILSSWKEMSVDEAYHLHMKRKYKTYEDVLILKEPSSVDAFIEHLRLGGIVDVLENGNLLIDNCSVEI